MRFLLKTIQKEAVFRILEDSYPLLVAIIMNSYTNIPESDPEFKKIFDDLSVAVRGYIL
jgi:hypothetical protein